MYEKGLYKPPQLPDSTILSNAKVYLLDSDLAVDMLQMMLNNDNIVAHLQAMAAEGEEAEDEVRPAGDTDHMSAAEAESMAGAATFSFDSYSVGERVIILSDEVDGQQLDHPVPVAEGIIRAAAQASTMESPFYEVCVQLHSS